MMENQALRWDIYWMKFDLLIENLKRNEDEQTIQELREAQRYVNGMTDGWYDFKTSLETILKTHRDRMRQDQVELTEDLIKTLNDLLTQR